MEPLLRSKFRVNIKSLQAESRFIKMEEESLKSRDIEYIGIRNHRIFNVRKESRITQLAYAIARGDTYRSVEPTVNNDLTKNDKKRLKEKLIRKSREFKDFDVDNWLEAAIM